MAVDFINSNIALFGSRLEHQVKETAAASALEWNGVETGPKIRVWRIEQFHVKPWPTQLYGQFHTGDSYIVLRRIGDHAPFSWNIHFWLGTESSIDERGVAAYKTVELDTRLGGVPVQYRELQGSESASFRELFPTLQYLPGGVASGLRHVDPSEYAGWTASVHTIGSVTITDRGRIVDIQYAPNTTHHELYQANAWAFSLKALRGDVTIMQHAVNSAS